MSSLVFFKDLRKRAADLLTKEFYDDKSEKKLEYKESTSSGNTFETSFVQDDKGAITGTVKPKVSISRYNAELSGEVTTKQDFKVEVSTQDQVVKGLKVLTNINQKKGETFGSLGAEYKHELATFTGVFDLGKKVGPSLAASLVFGKNGFSLGMFSKYLISKNSFEGVETVASYRSSEFDLSLFGRLKPDEKTKKDSQEVGFSYYHDLNTVCAFSSEGQYNLASKVLELAAGLQYKVNPDTTLKGKFSNLGDLGFVLQQKLNSKTSLTLSSGVNLQAIQSGKSGITFGLSISFNF